MNKIPETPADVKVQLQIGNQFETSLQKAKVECPRQTLQTGRHKIAIRALRYFLILGFGAVVIFILLVIQNRQEEFKSEFTQLKSQITSLQDKQQMELILIRETLNQEISLINAEREKRMNQTFLGANQNPEKESNQSSNQKHNITEPSTGSSSSGPRFFLDEQFKGAWYEPAPGWEKECAHLPSYMDQEASSIQLRGHCILICPGKYCNEARGYPWKYCFEIHPNSYGLDNLEKIEYNNMIRSFKPCSNATHKTLEY